MGTVSSIILLVMVVACIVFIVYDSARKRRQEPKLEDHHAAHPGCLGHPEGCEHMMTEEQQAKFWKELDNG